MLIKKRKSWEIPEGLATSESDYMNRRKFIGLSGLGLGALCLSPGLALGAESGFPSHASSNYKDAGSPVTSEKLVTTYNNFYEFSMQKGEVHKLAEGFPMSPWQIEIGGLVNKKITLDVEDLVKKFGLEQRVYRFRCVEAWSMVVPWDGFPLKKLVEFASPLASARYLKMTTFLKPDLAPGQKNSLFSWPYVEGLTMNEATNDLAFMATGIYGKPMPPQNGGPIRLVVPWKYGFKSVKSIVRFEFTSSQPDTLWNHSAPDEYGFYANVNPAIDHPRWSQATEKPLGSWLKRVDTHLYNGYQEQVAQLYQGLDLTKNY